MHKNNGLILRGDTWHMRFQESGVLVAESTHTSNRREAERILATRRAELVRQLVLGKVKPIKLHDAVDEFQRSRKHMKSYASACQHTNFFKLLPNTSLELVSDADWFRFLDGHRVTYAESYVAVTTRYFNAVLNLCSERGYSVRKKIKLIKQPQGKIRWLTNEEEAKLFAELDPEVAFPGKTDMSYAYRRNNLDLCILLSHTAARANEIRDLAWSQIDFINETVTIRRSKGGKNTTVPFTKKMREILTRRKELKDIGFHHVFPDFQGKANSTTHWLKTAVRRAGLSEVDGTITLHTFRHSRAVKWLIAGLNPKEVQEMLGHTCFSSTEVYLHLIPGRAAKAASQYIDDEELEEAEALAA